MKASSTLPIRNRLSCQASDGSILSDKGWCPRRRNSEDQWLEIDIAHPTLVTALVTKGKGDTFRDHWVTKYKVAFSNDSVLWSYYKDANHLEPKVKYISDSALIYIRVFIVFKLIACRFLAGMQTRKWSERTT
jgi:hypothetical protein